MKGSHLRRAVALLFVAMFPVLIYAQTTGSLSGTVADASGASIARASVTITETRTNAQRVLTTDSAGRFVANGIQAGTYEIKVEAAGFRPAARSGILLEALIERAVR